MAIFLGEDWKIKSAGGITGEAYVAQQGEEKLFIKRNSTPFIAVLSAEGIVPKLLWTKRLENGDVITAQRWIRGRVLRSSEMNGSNVPKLLSKIHNSAELLDLFKRMDNQPLTPARIIEDIRLRVANILIDDCMENAFIYLYENQDKIEFGEKVVCHCDVNHNNWIISDTGDLYLIDWDGAKVCDPALDLGILLYLYVPTDQWRGWLSEYGIEYTVDLHLRMKWYVLTQIIYSIIWHWERNEIDEMEKWKQSLTDLI